jgi:hypothetical protein
MKEDFIVTHSKLASSKRKRRMTALPVMGAAGMSLTLAGGASGATTGPVSDNPTLDLVPTPQITLGEEEISDVSLLTFYVFDKENVAKPQLGAQYAQWGRCGCRGCRCGGCRCGWRRCAGCGCGWGWGVGIGWGCCASWGRCRWC